MAPYGEEISVATTPVAGATLTPYLARVSEVPLLRPDEEVDLAKRADAGRQAAARLAVVAAGRSGTARLRRIVDDGRRASDLLVRANLRLVVSMARRYQGRGLDFADLIQEGNLGLLKAVERFDHTRGFRFSTYAAWWIRQTIGRGLADRSRPVRLPVHAHETLVKLRWIELELWQQSGREPTEAELAARLDLQVARLRDIREAARETTSLDAPVGADGDTSLGGLLPDRAALDPEREAIAANARDVLLAAVGRLDERERTVIELHFGLSDGEPRTLDQIGAVFGVTRERIRQVELRGLRKLAQRRLHDLVDAV